MEHFTTSKPQHFMAFYSAAAEIALATDEWASEGGQMHAMSGYIVKTPHAAEPYKVIFDHGDGPDTEQSCGTIKDCQALIRRSTTVPVYRSAFRDQRPFAL